MAYTLTPIANLKGTPGDLGGVVTLGNITGTVALTDTILELDAQIVTATLTGDVSMPAASLPAPPAGMGGTLTLVLTQDATGGHTLALPGVYAAYGAAPVLSTAANAVDVWHLLWDGTRWTVLPSAAAVAVPAGWVA